VPTALPVISLTSLSSTLRVLHYTKKCQIIVTGDFNIRIEKVSEPDTRQLNDILSSFLCTQHVSLMEKQSKGGTLDLVITKLDQLEFMS